jgi:hypothetical protein
MDYIIFLFIIYIVPAIILGILLGVPAWLYWIIQKLFRFHPSRVSLTFSILMALFSFIATFCIYTYKIIQLEYDLAIPSSPDPIYEEKIKYRDETINYAFEISIIPILHDSCANKPEPVCRLGKNFSLKIWDGNLTDDDAPFLGGIISSIFSILFIILGNNIFQE